MSKELREENKFKLDEFESELGFISNPKIRNIAEIAICHISIQFFIVAASSTGNHHPSYGLGYRGLLRHTRAAENIAHELKTINPYEMSEKDFDIAIAGLIIHDGCKRGVHFEERYTVHEHPLLVHNLVPEGTFSGEDLDIWNSICEAVSSHMGQWTTSDKSTVTLPLPKTNVQKFVHLCDYLGSRKMLEVVNIWSEDDKEIITNVQEEQANKPVSEPMTEKQENYIRKLISEYQNSCVSLNVECRYKENDDISFLNKKTASGFIGKIKKLLDANKELIAKKC